MNKFFKNIQDWYNDCVDFSDKLYEKEQSKKKATKTNSTSMDNVRQKALQFEQKEIVASIYATRIISVLFCLAFVFVMLMAVSDLPGFFLKGTPTDNEVAEHYVKYGREETGAVSAIAGMILDYRAFDTLGESFVLFTATCAVLILIEDKQNKDLDDALELVKYNNDSITFTISRILIPIILVFGVYVVLNGHLSPGGGFAGGAILGSGLIFYAMTYGEDRARKVLSQKRINIVTICALSFYCLAKSYSFFTGNEFNGIESIIGPGTPGTLISGGLILPLNIAVGIVVCCTMYSFYMLFKKGRIS